MSTTLENYFFITVNIRTVGTVRYRYSFRVTNLQQQKHVGQTTRGNIGTYNGNQLMELRNGKHCLVTDNTQNC